MRVKVFSSLDDLPPAFEALFEEAASESFFYSRPWFQNLLETTRGPHDRLYLYAIEGASPDETPLALMVARSAAPRFGAFAPRTLAGFTNFYTTFFGPLLRRDVRGNTEILRRLVAGLRSQGPRWDVIKLDSLDRDAATFDVLMDAFRSEGMILQPFFDYANLYTLTEGSSFDAYVSGLPAILRNTAKRRSRKLERSAKVRFELVTSGENVESAIETYEKVYATSWKQREPYPQFTGGLIRACAEAGCLRLGILYVDERPAAVQLWIVSSGKATIFKLAYDEHFKKFSVGTILTMHLMRHAIDVDRVREVDFGRGGDAYKSQWLPQHRERWGIMAFNPRTARGILSAVRHIGGHRAKNMVRRLLARRADCGAAPG